jgi:hypothetical protein
MKGEQNMTTNELHVILDDENKTITPQELNQIIYELKNDCLAKADETLDVDNPGTYKYYSGEANAFQIVLDLLDHLQVPKP